MYKRLTTIVRKIILMMESCHVNSFFVVAGLEFQMALRLASIALEELGPVSSGVWGEGELVGCSGDPWKERVMASHTVGYGYGQ